MSLSEHRQAIDQLDAKIVQLLNQRTQHVLAIGDIKLKAGEEIYAPHRERAVLERVCAHNAGPMTNDQLRSIYREIMFVDSDLKIVSQIILPVQQCLMSKAARSQIKKLYAHPQSLAQCRAWIQNHLPRAEIVETSSNARSAELAAQDKHAAALGGILAAEKYGLRVLEQDIQDNAANATRFLVLGRLCSPPTGDDRTSLMVSVADKSGALHQAIAAFRRFKINMTKIESRPSKRKAWEYFFFIDCAGHFQDAKVAKAIKLLGEQCNFVKILGSYPNVD
jgi:chorismate mutase/prephenate dehydratase